MGRVSDEERRDVARKLRAGAEYLPNDMYSDDLELELAKTVCRYDTPSVDVLFNRLADLMEPPTQCPYYHSDRHYCSVHEDLQVIDRDALLALADEMYRDGKMQRDRVRAGIHWFVDGLDVMDYARQIREALGVEDAGSRR